MKRMPYLRLAVAVFAGLYLQSCALDEYFESRLEKYTKSFIKEFGLIDPEQDWTMGKNENAEINVGPVAKSVKIYGKYGDTYYKVADLTDIGGSLSVPVHVPKTCTEMMVKVDGRTYYGKFGTSLNCTGVSGRGIVEYKDNTTIDESKNPPIYTTTVGGYKINVSHTKSGNDPDDDSYQRFNTQQMAPIVSREVWSEYYSLNTGQITHNDKNAKGILPESGIFNADRTYLNNVLDNANALSDVSVDFNIEAGDNGTFTLFPYYYGTNLIHELGVYLLGEDGEPLRSGGNLIKLPIFVDKDPGDMQIQPHYCEQIMDIRVYRKDGKMVLWKDPIEISVGEQYDLDVRLYNKKLNIDPDNGQSYYRDDYKNFEIPYDEAFKKEYHSRLAFHAWVDDKLDDEGNAIHPKRFGKQFVTCDEYGEITANIDTHGYDDEDMEEGRYYMTASIATGLATKNNMVIDGVAFDFPVVITDPNAVERKIGETGNGTHIILTNHNLYDVLTNTNWGDWGQGVESDQYNHCLYVRGGNTDSGVKLDSNKKPELAAGKLKMLFNDLKTSLSAKNEGFTIGDPWNIDEPDPNNAITFSDTDEIELLGLEYNSGSGEWWLQLDLWVNVNNSVSSAPRRSRAEIPAEYSKMLTYDNKIGWLDVHRTWTRFLPYGKEVASYPVDMPMLARTRGYDVSITNPDGTPYTGKFGMYITVAKENKMAVEVDANGGEKELDYVITGDLTKPYTLYSQQKLNTYGQRSAAAFNHPKSGRTFFTFEDMDLTHKAADEGGYAYSEYEKSSDRDINDLIFLLKGYEKIEGTKTITEDVKVVEEGFSWIWALEDLGSTGDFDFNDVVIRIKDITKTTKTTTTTTNENGQTTTTTKDEIIITPEITFLPLAAGGTLPIHIHFKYGDKDFVLAPGKYDLTNGQSPSELKAGKEWHKWFADGISSSTMINTGVGAHIPTSEKNACILIVDEGFKLENSLKFEKGSHGDGSNQSVLYVVVQGDGTETWSEMQKVDQDRMKDEDAYMLPLMEKGNAAQSFFILDNNGGTWRWMKEYQHICLGYPGFAEWIKNPGTDWTEKKDTEFLY